MHPLLHTPLSRRTALRGLGVSLSLPLLEAMLPRSLHAAPSTYKPLAKSGAKPTPRVIFCYVSNGVNILEWMPPDNGKGYKLSPTLETLKDHRENFSVLTGLGHPNSTGGHSGADIMAFTPGGEENEGDQLGPGVRPQAAEHPVSVQFRHLDVAEDQVWRCCQSRCHSDAAIFGGADAESLHLQNRLEATAHRGVVLDDQDVFHGIWVGTSGSEKTGSCAITVVPRPEWLWSVTLPPCTSTHRLTITRPRPVPGISPTFRPR